MNIKAIKTHKIVPKGGAHLFSVLDKYLSRLSERSILAVTSKIVSICEGRVIKIEEADKDELIRKEAQCYLPRSSSKYNVLLTITNSVLAASAGIDESNGNGYYILWPKDPQKSVNAIRSYLVKKFGLTRVGVLLTDSKTTPLRWGVTGFALAHSGFEAINNYMGKPDLFGRLFEYEKVNVADSLAAAAVAVIGEGDEQTPLAIIEDVPFVTFQDRNPTPEELQTARIDIEDDLYAPVLTSVQWSK